MANFDHIMTFVRIEGVIYSGSHAIVEKSVWSGRGEHSNHPEDEAMHAEGPLPAGVYAVSMLTDHIHLGHNVMALSQVEGNSYGRGGFFIHGDSQNDVNHSASEGCIIVSLFGRGMIDQLLRIQPEGRFIRVV